MVYRQDMHNTIREFKDVSNSVKDRHEQWESSKETLKELLVTIKDRAILEILDENYSVNITEDNDTIILKISNDYLEAQLNYEPLYNGKIKVYTIFPKIKNEEGEIKEAYINTHDPNEISEVKTITDIDSFFRYFKNKVSSIHS